MKRLSRIMLALIGLFVAGPGSAAQLVTEVIPLRHRGLEEIIPVVQPLVPAPGTVTGMNNQLVVRTTPDNLQAIKDVLSKLDAPTRRLLISVRQGRWHDLRLYLADNSGSYRNGDTVASAGKSVRVGRGVDSSVEGDGNRRLNSRVYSSRGRDDEVGVQRIQAVEGQEAFVQTGKSVPVADRYYHGWRGSSGPGGGWRGSGSVRYKDVPTGFYVVPRINGDGTVTLAVGAHSSRESRRSGSKFEFQSANTVVTGRLGEWMLVGGSEDDPTFSGKGTTFSTRRDANINHAIILKVTELAR